MIRSYNFPDPVTAHDAMCDQLIYGDKPGTDYDFVHGTEVGLHNVAIHCDTLDFNYNLKRLWVPPSRWTMMVRQYLDPVALEDCLAKIEDRMGPPRRGSDRRGISVVRTRLVQGRGVGRGVRRRWGSCMLSLSFRALPVPVVTLHSRTTYFGYLALVDTAVARAFGVMAAQRAGVPIESVQFVWYLELAQFHGFRSLAYALGTPSIKSQLDEDVDNRLAFSPKDQPGYRKILDGYARILKSDREGKLYGDEAFSSFARARRRFHTEVYGVEYADQFAGGSRNRGGKGAFPPLPDTWVRDLTLHKPLIARDGDNSYFDHDDDVAGGDDDED
jgi:hypothetical protein